MKFKVGDRVKFLDNGDIGTIIEMGGGGDYLVEFDNVRNFYHSGCVASKIGGGKPDHCYWCVEYRLEKVDNETIVIFRRGEEVIALDKRTNKRGVAKCTPADEFDFMVGAKLRFERLTTQPKCKVGDVVRITGGAGYHNLKIGSMGIVASKLNDKKYHIYRLRADKDSTIIQLVHSEDFEVVE